MTRIGWIGILMLISMFSYGQEDCDTYTATPLPSCACDDCGFMDPVWELTNNQSSVCEGEIFEVSGALSTPLDLIEDFHWFFVEPGTGEIVYDELLYDTSPVSYSYVFTEDVPCTTNSVLLEIILLITSETCDEGESCREKSTKVQVKLLPRANFQNVQEVCVDVPVVFDNLTCHGDSAVWNYGDGTMSYEWDGMHSYASEGTYTVTMTAFNDCGEDTQVQQIEVIGLPEADASYTLDPASGCTDVDVLFDNQINPFENNSSAFWTVFPLTGWYFSDTIYSANSWDNGITFNDPGTYGVELTVQNICGIDYWSDSIQVFEAPQAFFNTIENECIAISGTSVIVDLAAHLNLTGSACGYDWIVTKNDNGQMFTSSIPSPVFTFTEPGEYEVSLFIDGCECGDLELNTSFFIQVPEILSFDIPVNIVCSNSAPFVITPSVPGGIWSGSSAIDSDGIFDPSLANIGNNILTYTVGTGACESSESITITVVAAPTVSIAPQIAGCDDLSYTPDVAYAGSYLDEMWTLIDSDGNETIYDPDVTPINIDKIGDYQFVVELIGDCNSVSDTIDISIIESIPGINAGVDATVCINDGTYSLMGMPAGFTWAEIDGTGNGLNVNTGELNLQLAGGGIHQYEYSYGLNSECPLSDIVVIEIIDFSGVSAGADISVCEGALAFQLTGASQSGGEWIGPGITDPDGTFDPSTLAAGNSYIVEYCLSNDVSDCSACDQKVITIDPLPTAAFQIIGTNCVGETLDLENLSTGACSYFWDFGNGQTSSLATPSPVYAATGTYIISLMASSCINATCAQTFSIEITVTEPAYAAFAQSTTEGCGPLDVTFENLSEGTDLSFFWDFGNGQTSAASSPGTITFEPGTMDTTFLVNLAVTNGCGTVNFTQPITVFPIPIVEFSPNEDDGCSPLSLDFSNITLGNPDSFAWYIDDVLVSTDSLLMDQIFTTSDTAISYYDITLVATNSCGIDSQFTTITVYPPDVTAFIFQDTAIGCQPLTVQFESYATPGATVSWDFGDGNGSSAENPLYTFDSAGIFTIYQYASNCGTDVDSAIVEVLPAPDVSFTHAPYACVGQAILFQNTSFGINGSEWDFGDGDTSLLSSPDHIYEVPGTYTVTLTSFSSSNNCPASFQSELLVLGNPTIAFEPSVFNGCAPLSIDFENLSSGANYYDWDFGNGEVSSEVSPQDQIFYDPGTYQVTLIGTDTFGCFSDTSIINILVNESPASGFTTNENEFCSGVDVITTTNTSQGANQYYWSFGNAEFSQLFEPEYIPIDTGQLTISLIAENEFLCQDTAALDVYVLGTPIAFTPLSQLEGCSPFPVEFGNASQYADQFFWDFGEGNTTTDTFPTFEFEFPYEFMPYLVAMNSNGCPNDTLIFDITVNPTPTSSFEIEEDVTCGLVDTIFVLNNSDGGTDFNWDFGNGDFSTLFQPSYVYESPGEYEITLIVSNEFSCRDTSSGTVSINLQPIAHFEIDDYDGCVPDSINFLHNSTDFDNLYWDFGDGNFSELENPAHTFTQVGDYYSQLIASYNNTCFDTFNLEYPISILPSPIADFTYDDLKEGQIQFINQSVDATYFDWDFGTGDYSTDFSPLYEYVDNGIWQVQLIATHPNGCTDEKNETVSPEIFFGMYFPNAMSPESGVGDVKFFKPVGVGIKAYTVSIYSPWGQLVWEDSELEGERPKAAWDGTFNEEYVPQGAYVWKAEIEFLNDVKIVEKGIVNVLR